jgi:hypothetical protein
MTKFAVMLILCAVAATGQPNLTGVWEGRGAEQRILLRIDQQGDAFDLTIRALGIDQHLRAAIGRMTENSIRDLAITAEARWEGPTLELRMHAAPQGKDLNITSRYSLSADGATLTDTEARKFADEAEVTRTTVYQRLPDTAWVKDPPPTPAESVYKNIQIMKGVPVPKLLDAMNNLTKWLGVNCAYCHVAGHFESDEKPAKLTARTMFTMVRALNKDSFPKTNAVTCWTCHRGASKPQSLPAQ